MNDDGLRIAVLSPVWFPVPPSGYGGIEWIVSLLADGLVDELFLTLAPVITGDDDEPAIVSGGRLPELAHAELRWALRSGSELFLRYGL